MLVFFDSAAPRVLLVRKVACVGPAGITVVVRYRYDYRSSLVSVASAHVHTTAN